MAVPHSNSNEEEQQIVERVQRDFMNGTANFRRRIIEVQREHMQAYEDAMMRSRLAYIRTLDHLLQTMLRLSNARQHHPLIVLLRNAMRRHMNELDRADETVRSFRRQSMHVSFRDLVGDFNHEFYRDVNDAGFADNVLRPPSSPE